VRPKTRYARSGDVNIAYQVLGDGPTDLVVAIGAISHLDAAWDIPPFARLYERLASFSRLILFDKRGTGLSDPVAPESIPTLEQRIDDVRAVMDAVSSERAALLGTSGGGAMCGLFAAMYPHRVERLILYGTILKMNYHLGTVPRVAKSWEAALDRIEREWADLGFMLELWAPSIVADDRLADAYSRLSRASVSPRSARTLFEMGGQVDWTEFLPAIRVPTLVLHRTGDRFVPVAEGRRLAGGITGSKYVEVPGDDHLMWAGDQDALISEIQAFLTGSEPIAEPDRILTTILFTDIVGSTDEAARLGDQQWRQVREEHDRVVRGLLDRFRGREVETAGDSFLATFDGPARGIRCASAIHDEVRALGLSIRAGLHTGECELVPDGGIRGLAVNIAARVSALAGSGEILVSSTVKDLVAGADIEFLEYGAHELKGLPGEWRLFLAHG
jgi:class 3 adenylate cyclase